MDEPFVRCEGLVKIYKVANLEVFALQGLDLQIQRGELLGIVGASGSGKSTLMNILGGLDRPSAGRVWVDGVDLLKLNDQKINLYRSTKVGFVWQQGARNLIPYLSALENVKLPMTIGGRGSQVNAKKQAAELLEAVGLSDRRHHRLEELSGGEQQRAAIAVSLANRPALLLADEPTGEVDTNTALGIFKVFQDVNEQYGMTTIIVSHDGSIARHVNRVVAIRDGKTSTETVRTLPGPAGPLSVEGAAQARHEEMSFEEVTLLDAAGRLQVPGEYLEKFAIKGRVYLEITDGGILIRPARPTSTDSTTGTVLPGEIGSLPSTRGLRALISRLRGRRQS